MSEVAGAHRSVWSRLFGSDAAVQSPISSRAASHGEGDGLGYGVGMLDAPFRAGGFGTQDTAEWFPSFGSADSTVLGSRDLAVNRIRDVVRNDPTARSAVERLVDLLVGSGLRLSSKPDGDALGLLQDDGRVDAKATRKLGKQIEREWRRFAEDPRKTADANRRLSMNGLWRLFVRTWVISGECTYLLTWKPGDQPYSTCVMPIDPDRVSNPSQRGETALVRGGVEMAKDGTPVAYHVREAHAADYWSGGQSFVWTRVPRATTWGRPVFVHGFEPDREGQTRAITPFASLVSRLRMIGKHADHELAAAAANALNVAFVESDLPADEVQQRLAQGGSVADRKSYAGWVMNWFERSPAKVGGVRIPVMPPGTTVKMNNAPRQTTSFPAFQTAFLHSIAASLNISYEQLTMDWSRVNYSSARAALNEVWRSVQRMASAFVEQVVQPVFHAVIEEAFDKGFIIHPHANDNGAMPLDAPDFWDAPGAYLRARWIGPFRGSVDPLKEAEAAGMRMELMVSTLEIECAAMGHDYLDILDQAAVEQDEIAARGLSRRSVVDAVRQARGPHPDNSEVDEAPAGSAGAAIGEAA